jgi:hypothetical protein
MKSSMDRPVVRAVVLGTEADDEDMKRMHKPQELNVRFIFNYGEGFA